MTNEPTDQGMMRLAFPDIAYSYVEFPLGIDVGWVISQMKAAEDAYRETFAPSQMIPPPFAGQSWGTQSLPRPSSNVPQRAQAGAHGGNSYGVEFVCPDHGDQLAPSLRNKQMDFVEELGRELPASWFHTGPDGKSCSTYLSRLRGQLT